MAVTKAVNANDIINGAAVVLVDDKKTQLYDNAQRTQHFTSANVGVMAVTANRYLKHGGVGGSGTWEH